MFTERPAQSDDITVVMMEYRGEEVREKLDCDCAIGSWYQQPIRRVTRPGFGSRWITLS